MIDVGADTLDGVIEPLLSRDVGSLKTASSGLAFGMGLDFVRRTEHDVDAAAIGLPSWNRLAPPEVHVGNSQYAGSVRF